MRASAPALTNVTSGGVTNVIGSPNQIDVTGSSTKTVTFDPVAQIPTSNSFAPTGSGQTVGSQVWLTPSLVAPAGTGVNSGGTLVPNHVITIAYTFNTAAGQTPLSPSATVVTPVSCSPTCSATVTAPTIPSGYTGYTVYDCDATASPGCTPIQQAASNNCVNITANCTIATLAAGGSAPTTITAYLQPPNVQTSECPPGVIPSVFEPDNSGNYHTWVGVDPNSSNSQTSGTPTICHRTWFNDTLVTPPQGNNAFVVIDHTAGVGTSTATQDRALWVGAGTPTGDSATRDAVEGIQSELDFNCNGCSINGTPDGEVTDASFNTTDKATTTYTASGYGVNVIRASMFQSGPGFTSAYNVLYGQLQFNQAANGLTSGTTGATVRSTCSSTNSQTGLWCFGFYHRYNASATGWQAALMVPNGQTPGGSNNYFVINDVPGLPSLLNGQTTVTGLGMNNVAPLPVTASMNVAGAISSTQPTIAAPASVVCTGGSSTYGYKFVAADGNGGTVASSQQTCTTGVNPLTSGNPATVNPPATFNVGAIGSFVRIDVYRTSGPMATGKIGSLTCTAPTGLITSGICNAFSDTGLSADGGTAPSTNTTGTVSTAGYAQHSANKFFVTTNFTTAANTSLQTITGLTFNLLPAAANYQFHCALSYSQATANAAVAFGIQAATVNPTNIFAMGGLGTSATAGTSGVLPTLATTTATAIVSATPSATATNFTAVLDGTIEEPANDAGQAINIMVSTATAADAVTVLRGSYCYLY